MINISFVTNSRAPYRKKQLEKLSEIPNVSFKVFYTNPKVIEREWIVEKINNIQENPLKGINLLKKYGYLNIGLKKIIEESDIIVIGGYEQPTYQILAFLSRIYKKKYVLLFDGISPQKIENKRGNIFKYILKKFVIDGSSAIFGNGKVAKEYFTKIFNYPEEKIFNQYLTVDVKKIRYFALERKNLNKNFRNKFNIKKNDYVIIYSGRLIKRKNVDLIIKAIENLPNVFLLLIGDGEERNNIEKLAKEKKIRYYITGFIKDQEELFKMYYCGDLLILISYNEPWGLVINEAMAAGLPVICSNHCGSSLDLVKDGVNGYILDDLKNEKTLQKLILKIRDKNKYNTFSKNSLKIINEWTFESSKESFEKMLNRIIIGYLKSV